FIAAANAVSTVENAVTRARADYAADKPLLAIETLAAMLKRRPDAAAARTEMDRMLRETEQKTTDAQGRAKTAGGDADDRFREASQYVSQAAQLSGPDNAARRYTLHER